MPAFPVTYSIPAPGTLAQLLESTYDLGDQIGCKLWKSGMNTTYAVEASRRYMLRIYRTGRRTAEEIQYELDLLCHLGRKGVPVARPVAARDGRLFLELDTPEGIRHAVLFEDAGGYAGRTDEGLSYRLGQVAAQIHLGAVDYQPAGKRQPIDLELLIEQPTFQLNRRLSHVLDQRRHLNELCERVRAALSPVLPSLQSGVCHGDLFRGNCHQLANGGVVVFDFDECGPGPRAYDLAVYWWSVRREGRPDEMWQHFMEGYLELGSLTTDDQKALPLLAAARQIWFMGQLAGEAADWLGHLGLDDQFFARQADVLAEWVSHASSPLTL